MAELSPIMPSNISGPILPSPDSIAALSTSIIFGVVATCAVIFRLRAQRRTRAGITTDAYLIIAALMVTLGICGLASYMALCAGLGWPLGLLSEATDDLYLKCLNAHQMMWAITVACIRASLLLFYRRIFSTNIFRRTVLGALCFNTLYLLIFIVVTALSFSLPAIAESSNNYSNWLIANGCVDIVQDLSVLCLPLFVIRKLQMSKTQKIGLISLFWLGAFCVVASIARVVYFVQLLNPMLDNAGLHDVTGKCIMWSTIQPCTSIIAACLPTYRPLLRNNLGLRFYLSSAFSILRTDRTTPATTELKTLDRQVSTNASQNGGSRLHSKGSSHVESRSTKEVYDMVDGK